MKTSKLILLCVFLTACRSAPTRQEIIDSAVSARAAADALNESKKELESAADELESAADDAADSLPDGKAKTRLNAAVSQTQTALSKAVQAGEQCKTALDDSQKLLAKAESRAAQAEKERDENAVDARRWRIAMWVVLIGGPLALGFILWRRLRG